MEISCAYFCRHNGRLLAQYERPQWIPILFTDSQQYLLSDIERECIEFVRLTIWTKLTVWLFGQKMIHLVRIDSFILLTIEAFRFACDLIFRDENCLYMLKWLDSRLYLQQANWWTCYDPINWIFVPRIYPNTRMCVQRDKNQKLWPVSIANIVT